LGGVKSQVTSRWREGVGGGAYSSELFEMDGRDEKKTNGGEVNACLNGKTKWGGSPIPTPQIQGATNVRAPKRKKGK